MARHEGRSAPPAAAVLDEGYVGRLEEQIGPTAMAELLADGLVEVSDRLERLAAAVADGDRATALRIVHDMTSVAGHMGLAQLSIAAAHCQRALRSEPQAPLGPAAAPVLEAGPEACAAMRARIGPDPAGGARHP